MSKVYSEQSRRPISEFLTQSLDKRMPRSFALELTARCNNDCRHCCINLPAGDTAAQSRKLTLDEVKRIAADAVGMGAVSCLIAGGEPLLRDDFEEAYVMLKRLGLLVSVCTNAGLVSPRHAELFRRYPPRGIDVSVFGSASETYERVTRRPGSFGAFEQGLNRLLESGLNVSLTAVGLRSNVHDLPGIARFCRARVKGNYRIDPILPLRIDGDPVRNEEIMAERLSPAEVAAIERSEAQRPGTLPGESDAALRPEGDRRAPNRSRSLDFVVGYDGRLRLRSANPEAAYDLRHGSLREAWRGLAHQTGARPPGNEGDAFTSPTSQSGLTGSREFLLRCLSVAGSDSPEPTIPGSPDEWSGVVELARSLTLASLLYKRIESRPTWSTVPPDVRLGLTLDYSAGRDRGARLYGILQIVLRHLHNSGIPVIVLKGAYLAEAVYGDVAVRPMADVDLMVPRADLPKAHAVLLEMGRVHQQPEDVESRFGRSRASRLAVGAGIDLCWTIDVPGGRSRLDLTGLWDRARPATIAGVEVLALSPEDFLLHLCLHASHRHGLEAGLRPFCDIAETICHFRGEMDWPRVVARSREWDAARYVGLTLQLARSMLGAGVPDGVLEQLVPGGIDHRILEMASESVLAETGYLRRLPFFGRLGARSLRDKARLSWERIFLSRDEMAATYPASRKSRHLYVYYALRLRSVIRTYWLHARTRWLSADRRRGRDRNAALVNWLKSGKL